MLPPNLLGVKPGPFWPLVIAIIFYALGFGLFRPLVDALFADHREERAGLYGLNSALTQSCARWPVFAGAPLNGPVAIYLSPC